MPRKRRSYTREFKVEAVRLVTEEGYSLREAAENLGVSENALRTWRKQLVDKGNCWDNAVMESFYRSIKTELIHHEDFQTRDESRLAIFEYIEVFYNRLRRHSTLGYVSPCEYEQAS